MDLRWVVCGLSGWWVGFDLRLVDGLAAGLWLVFGFCVWRFGCCVFNVDFVVGFGVRACWVAVCLRICGVCWRNAELCVGAVWDWFGCLVGLGFTFGAGWAWFLLWVLGDIWVLVGGLVVM